MDRRHQIFVSSTFEDLRDARNEVSTALLKSDCFPAGMELFPAADLEQFDYIKEVIADCDYFLIVSAGKYGSVHPKTKLSFTEMEYDYAIEIGKPIIRLLHKDPFNQLRGKEIEQTASKKKKLEALRLKLTKSHLVNFWNDTKELGQQTILALLDIKKRTPSAGWVRGQNAMTVEMMQELEALRQSAQSHPKKNVESLVSFDDLKKKSDVSVMVATAVESDVGTAAGTVEFKNKEIAEAVFLALISHRDTRSIGESASDILGRDYEFPESYQKHDHFWLELGFQTVRYCLHYLEGRDLVRGPASTLVNDWVLSSRGRQHATFMSGLRNFG